MTKFSRRAFLSLAGGGLLVSALPARGAGRLVLHGAAFGSSWSLVADAPVDEAAIVAAFGEIVESVDRAMSPFRADSELSRFNRARGTDWLPMSAATCAVVEEGLRVAALTRNAFNPTVGPLVGRYGFGPITDGEPGSPGEISVRGGAVRKARPALSLDLCGIAKGHALDRMAAACAEHGIADFLIELGGEIFARGAHPAGRGWQVGVERPASAGGGIQRVVAPGGAALATSGDAVNAYVHGGRRYSHIIDPATGRPADSALASVTVAAPGAMTADALATALFAMGPERGPAFARDKGIEALFVVAEGEHATEIVTGGFEARILG